VGGYLHCKGKDLKSFFLKGGGLEPKQRNNLWLAGGGHTFLRRGGGLRNKGCQIMARQGKKRGRVQRGN